MDDYFATGWTVEQSGPNLILWFEPSGGPALGWEMTPRRVQDLVHRLTIALVSAAEPTDDDSPFDSVTPCPSEIAKPRLPPTPRRTGCTYRLPESRG